MVAQKSSKIMVLSILGAFFLTEKYKKRLYPEFTKALHQPLTLTIQDDTLSSLLILVSSEVSFF